MTVLGLSVEDFCLQNRLPMRPFLLTHLAIKKKIAQGLELPCKEPCPLREVEVFNLISTLAPCYASKYDAMTIEDQARRQETFSKFTLANATA